MPELPEVETVVKHITPYLIGKRFATLIAPLGYTRAINPYPLPHSLGGFKITALWRRGKYILMECTKEESAHSCLLSFHLRMTGKMLTSPPLDSQYVTVLATFEDGSGLWFHDVRKFGRITWYPNRKTFEHTHDLGIEPLSALFTLNELRKRLGNERRGLKTILLDQKVIAGLGNIYVDEVLWHACVHPLRKGLSLNESELVLLHEGIVSILSASINMHGTTFLSFYFGNQKKGNYAELLKVFGKKGIPCPRCHTPIVKTRLAGRGTSLCPSCQCLGKCAP